MLVKKAKLMELKPILTIWKKIIPSGNSTSSVASAISRVALALTEWRPANDLRVTPSPLSSDG